MPKYPQFFPGQFVATRDDAVVMVSHQQGCQVWVYRNNGTLDPQHYHPSNLSLIQTRRAA